MNEFVQSDFVICRNCDGKGYIFGKKGVCPICKGKGELRFKPVKKKEKDKQEGEQKQEGE